MTTLNDLTTMVARDIRDIGFDTFSSTEVQDFIHQGLDAVADFFPKEIAQAVATVSANVYTYAVADFTNIYRIDIHDSSGKYRGELPHAYEGRDSGWELHGGVLYIPPNWPLSAGDRLRAFGYGRYIQFTGLTTDTEIANTGTWAIRVFARMQAFDRLLFDRALFTQWQAAPGNTDVSAMALNQLAFSTRQAWAAEKQRLRRVRKL